MSEGLIKYTKFFLPNGIKVILYKRAELHSVSIAVKVNVGSLDEDTKNNGISHLLEHLPFDGTEKFKDWKEVDKFNNSISGSGNAYTSVEHTKYHGIFPSQYLEQALDYYSQLVLFPLFDEDAVKKERDIVLDEMKRSEDSVESKVYEVIRMSRFSNQQTPYSFQVIGNQENVSSFSREDIKNHYNKYYLPENIEIYIVGNYDDKEIKFLLEKYFYKSVSHKNFEKKVERKFLKEFPDYSNFRIDTLQKGDVDQYYLSLTFPSFERANQSFYKRIGVPFIERTLASSQYQQSILWKRLREELGLIYGVSAYQYDLYKRSMFIIETSFNPEYLETILTEIYLGINKLKTKDVSDDIFKTRQKRLVDTQLMILDSPESIINWIEEQEEELELNGKENSIEEYMEMIAKYKFEEVLESADSIINWEDVNIGLVSKENPEETKDKVKELWKKITS